MGCILARYVPAIARRSQDGRPSPATSCHCGIATYTGNVRRKIVAPFGLLQSYKIGLKLRRAGIREASFFDLCHLCICANGTRATPNGSGCATPG
jgi:hypothetical protein